VLKSEIHVQRVVLTENQRAKGGKTKNNNGE
jgi:hypothetical protein